MGLIVRGDKEEAVRGCDYRNGALGENWGSLGRQRTQGSLGSAGAGQQSLIWQSRTLKTAAWGARSLKWMVSRPIKGSGTLR